MKKLILLLILLLAPSLYAQSVSTSSIALTASSVDCATTSSCVSVVLPAGIASAAVQITGTFTATLQFEGTVDGTNWVSITGYTPAGAEATSATVAGVWQFNASSFKGLRTRVSAYTSSPTVKIVATSAPFFVGGDSTVALALEDGGNLAAILAQITSDPCQDQTLVASVPIYTNADLKLVTGQASKKVYICAIAFNTTSAQQVGIVEGTGTNCGDPGVAGVIGGDTDAKGFDLTDNQGMAFGNGGSWVARTATNADDLCIFVSGSAYVRGVLKYAID